MEIQSRASTGGKPFLGEINRTLARVEGEEEELEVIGSGISGSFQPQSWSRPRLPMLMPKLKYDYPEASEENFSPGTSLIFNAYRGNSGLLTQPYMAIAEEDQNPYHRIEAPDAQRWPEQAHQNHLQHRPLSSHRHEENSYSSQWQPEHPYHQRPYDHSYLPHTTNDHNRGSDDYHGVPGDYDEARSHDSKRPPRPMSPSPTSASLLSSTAERCMDKNHENRSQGPRVDYAPQTTTPPHSNQSNSQCQKYPEHGYGGGHRLQETMSGARYHPFQSHPSAAPQQHRPAEESSEHRYSTPAVDIPQPRNRTSIDGAGDYGHEDPMENRGSGRPGYRQPQQPQYAQNPLQTQFNQRGMGPRYALTRTNYRMIFEYASEIKECLLNGKAGATDRLLYNAEILSKVFMGCRVDKDPRELDEDDTQALNPHQLRCTSCNIVKTPEWRKGPLVWGKISRGKAALAKSKQGTASTSKPKPSKAAGDTQMAQVATSNSRDEVSMPLPNVGASVTMGTTRKRGRDLSSTMEADEVESSARDEDVRSMEVPGMEVETLNHQQNVQDARSRLGNQPSIPVNDHSPKKPATDESRMVQQAVAPTNRGPILSQNAVKKEQSLPSFDSSKVAGHGSRGTGAETPVTDRKLALSFLLE
ncbi:hypothetical protein BG011_006767 [Mortierella polycephala]|uniref:GATA-type domain-containing protein n=1 Tax=Mortierella polycephala TaxID=41804 RepID=A0A9P6QF96_9FUNG|nr:hypothetical protein BG011_006767 [Mortierella polycephala]